MHHLGCLVSFIVRSCTMFIDDVKFYKAKSLMFYNVGQPIQLS